MRRWTWKAHWRPGKFALQHYVLGSWLGDIGFFECGLHHFLRKIIILYMPELFKATCTNLIYGTKKSRTICEQSGMWRATPSSVSTRDPLAPWTAANQRATENIRWFLVAGNVLSPWPLQARRPSSEGKWDLRATLESSLKESTQSLGLGRKTPRLKEAHGGGSLEEASLPELRSQGLSQSYLAPRCLASDCVDGSFGWSVPVTQKCSPALLSPWTICSGWFWAGVGMLTPQTDDLTDGLKGGEHPSWGWGGRRGRVEKQTRGTQRARHAGALWHTEWRL